MRKYLWLIYAGAVILLAVGAELGIMETPGNTAGGAIAAGAGVILAGLFFAALVNWKPLASSRW